MSEKSLKNVTLKELIQDIDYRLAHLEDITADNRKLMVKLIKQGNSIVEYLKDCEFEMSEEVPSFTENDEKRKNDIRHIRELIDEFMEKQQDLKEFEEELKKNKDKLTPGQIGES